MDWVSSATPAKAGGHSGTDAAAAISRDAADLGAAALMVLPPSFMKTDGDGLLRYHDAISRSARRQSEGCARARAGEGMWNATTLNRVWIRSNSPLGSIGGPKIAGL